MYHQMLLGVRLVVKELWYYEYVCSHVCMCTSRCCVQCSVSFKSIYHIDRYEIMGF